MLGKTLGHYQITGELGRGGMGEVYRAHDARLDRDVAIKVLPDRLSENPEARARFEREAKTISSLNHPHICVLHDIGREGDVDYLVMELIEGETLADRLAKGPLPTAEALRVARQVADALDRAHQAGVVHRDLKPGNIMLTRSGAKLMDFGLARVLATAAPEVEGLTVAQATQSPTMDQPLTAEGSILGTFQYMAPEQLEGREADERADVWALGCVLHEMATGQRAFEGTTQASLIGAILHTQPEPVSHFASVSPPELDRLVRACLAKDPEDRIRSAHDIKLQLSWIEEGSSTMSAPIPGAPAATPPRSAWLRSVGIGFVAAVLASAVTIVALRNDGSPARPATVERFALTNANLYPTSTPEVSADGTSVFVAVREGSSSRIFRRDLNSFDLVPIPGTDGGWAPFLSPDGAWLGFLTEDAVKKVPVQGGVAQVVARIQPNAADWGEDGTIWVSLRSGGPDGTTALVRVPAEGGTVETVARLLPEEDETEAWLPEVLPGGETVLLSCVGPQFQVVALDRAGNRKPLLQRAFSARYVDSGHLLYVDRESDAVLAVPFDPVAVEVTGSAIPVTGSVVFAHCFDTNRAGDLAYVPLQDGGGSEVIWANPGGDTVVAMDRREDWATPRISPDGSRVILRRVDAECEVWMLDVERGSISRIVQEGDAHDAIWSPDGRNIVFDRDNTAEMVIQSVLGARRLEVVPAGRRGSPTSWSTGDLLAFEVDGPGTRSDIWVMGIDGTPEPSAFVATPADERRAVFSPDGRWIAYDSDEGGVRQIYLRSFPDSGSVWQVSIDSGQAPAWSRDGRSLYFVSGSQHLRASFEGGEEPTLGRPEVVLDRVLRQRGNRDYDVGPDGRFIGLRADLRAGVELRLVRNWAAGFESTRD